MRTSLSTLSTLARVLALGIAGAALVTACGGQTVGSGGPGGGGSSSGGGSGSGGGGSSVIGSVSGVSLTIASQVAAVEPESSSCTGTGSSDGGQSGETCTSAGQVVLVVLTNRADATCALAQSEETSQQGVELANFDELELAVGAGTGTVAPGTYAVQPTLDSPTATGAEAQFGTTDATCATMIQAQAESGTVTLTAISATNVSGTYDVSFGSEGSLTGSFDIPICVLPTAGTGTGTGSSTTECK